MKDIEALYGSNVCTEEEGKKCLERIGEDEEAIQFQKSACEKCEKRKPKQISPWTIHILQLRVLMKAGYPFLKTDLSGQEWLDLGFANEIIEMKTRTQ